MTITKDFKYTINARSEAELLDRINEAVGRGYELQQRSKHPIKETWGSHRQKQHDGRKRLNVNYSAQPFEKLWAVMRKVEVKV